MHPPEPQADITIDHATAKADRSAAANLHGNPFSVRFRYRERRLIAARADAEGTTMGQFIRKCVLTKCGQPPSTRVARRDKLAREVETAVGELGRISNSANQLAHAGNSGQLRDGETAFALGSVERQLLRVHELLRSIGGSIA